MTNDVEQQVRHELAEHGFELHEDPEHGFVLTHPDVRGPGDAEWLDDLGAGRWGWVMGELDWHQVGMHVHALVQCALN